jgi:hypothetical protein
MDVRLTRMRIDDYSKQHSRFSAQAIAAIPSPSSSPSPPPQLASGGESTSPTPAPRQSQRQSQETSNRPPIPLFNQHQSHLSNSSTATYRTSASRLSYQQQPQQNTRTMKAFHQPPPIPNRNSSLFNTSPSPTQPQMQFIITPSALATPQKVHSYKPQPNSMQYASTIRPVSLDPVPEHEDDQMNQSGFKFSVEPTIEDLDVVFGTRHSTSSNAALAQRSAGYSDVLNGPRQQPGRTSPQNLNGRVSPLNLAPINAQRQPVVGVVNGSRQQGRTNSQKLNGRVSPLAMAPTNVQKQPAVLQQRPWPPSIQLHPQSPQSKRLSGIGVTRLSTASTAAGSEGKRGSMMVGGNAQTGWYRQPGVGVGFLPA